VPAIVFSEPLVRNVAQVVLWNEYRREILNTSAVIIALLILIAALGLIGLLASNIAIGLIVGLGFAAVLMGIIYGNGYIQSLRFALRVFRNEGVAEVDLEITDTGCCVRYKSSEVQFRWQDLRKRVRLGSFDVLGFEAGQPPSGSAASPSTIDALSRGIAGTELMGFPIFCPVPSSRNRYVIVPANSGVNPLQSTA